MWSGWVRSSGQQCGPMLLEVLSCSARHSFIARNRLTVLGTAALAVEEDQQQSWTINWVVEQRQYGVDDATRVLHAGGTEKDPLVFIPKSSSAFGKVLTDDTGQD
jgi:hypothetical protein